MPDQFALFADATALPGGLRYVADFIPEAVEQDLIDHVAALPLQPSAQIARRTSAAWTTPPGEAVQPLVKRIEPEVRLLPYAIAKGRSTAAACAGAAARPTAAAAAKAVVRNALRMAGTLFAGTGFGERASATCIVGPPGRRGQERAQDVAARWASGDRTVARPTEEDRAEAEGSQDLVSRIAVVGSGAWGTTMSVVLGSREPVTLLARRPDKAARIEADRRNDDNLPGIALPDTVSATADAGFVCAIRRVSSVGGRATRNYCRTTPKRSRAGVAKRRSDGQPPSGRCRRARR